MDFTVPQALEDYYAELVAFIENTIIPLEQADDNIPYFDHRREYARTDFENGGLPRHEWEDLLRQSRKLADAAGHWRFSAPKKYGGKDGSNLWMAVIRDRFAARGLGLHNVTVTVDGPELPALDGSAAAWVALLDQAGVVHQSAPARRLRVLQPFHFAQGDSALTLAERLRPALAELVAAAESVTGPEAELRGRLAVARGGGNQGPRPLGRSKVLVPSQPAQEGGIGRRAGDTDEADSRRV